MRLNLLTIYKQEATGKSPFEIATGQQPTIPHILP